GHAAQDGVGDCFRGIAARRLVAVELLDPFQVDDRGDADQQIDVLGDVDLIRHHGAVQALVEEQIRIPGHAFPLREGSCLLTVARALDVVVQILAHLSGPVLGIAAEQALQLGEQIRLWAEMAETLIFACDRLRQLLLHPRTIVAVEAVTFDECRLEMLAAKDLLESLAHRGSAGSGGAGDCDDRMARGHDLWPRSDVLGEKAARGEERRVELELVVIPVIPLDALDLRARAEHEADALVQTLGPDIENGPEPGARAAARLLDEVADRIRLVEQPQPSRLGRTLRSRGYMNTPPRI